MKQGRSPIPADLQIHLILISVIILFSWSLFWSLIKLIIPNFSFYLLFLLQKYDYRIHARRMTSDIPVYERALNNQLHTESEVAITQHYKCVRNFSHEHSHYGKYAWAKSHRKALTCPQFSIKWGGHCASFVYSFITVLTTNDNVRNFPAMNPGHFGNSWRKTWQTGPISCYRKSTSCIVSEKTVTQR